MTAQIKVTRDQVRLSVPAAQQAITEDVQRLLSLNGDMTSLYVSLATHKVALAQNFTYKGVTDWTFQSEDFRKVWNETLKAAGFDKEAIYKAQGEEAAKIVNRVHSAIRYHVSTVVRQVAPKGDRDKLGLKAESQRESKSTQARTPEARVSIPGVKLTEAASSHAIEAARHLSTLDCVGTIEEALSLTRLARAFPMPETEDTRNMLLMVLSALTQEATAYAESVKSYAPAEEKAKAAATA